MAALLTFWLQAAKTANVNVCIELKKVVEKKALSYYHLLVSPAFSVLDFLIFMIRFPVFECHAVKKKKTLLLSQN